MAEKRYQKTVGGQHSLCRVYLGETEQAKQDR